MARVRPRQHHRKRDRVTSSDQAVRLLMSDSSKEQSEAIRQFA